MIELFKTLTTAQAVTRLRKTHSDKDILLIANELPRGIREAVNSIINKEVHGSYSSEEREPDEHGDNWDE